MALTDPQGYFFGKPLSGKAMGELLAAPAVRVAAG